MTNREMTITLKAWRQAGPDAPGAFETYEVPGVSPDMSFLEMLDLVNERLMVDGKEPIVMTTAKAFGWVVQVTPPGPSPALRFNVAEPDKSQAVEAVRRRVHQASGASVEATSALSSHDVYGVLRLKRGDVSRAD